MGCVLSSDWCGEEEVQPVPVVRNSSLKRSLERSESGRMRLTKVSVVMFMELYIKLSGHAYGLHFLG